MKSRRVHNPLLQLAIDRQIGQHEVRYPIKVLIVYLLSSGIRPERWRAGRRGYSADGLAVD